MPPLSIPLLSLLALLPALCPAADPSKVWKEADLRPYTEGDTILLAINRTVYDVSDSPKFYGPGGPYHHFTGRDASRAWVTECWDDADQLTWRMDGLEAMFLPRYLDELMDDLAAGKDVPGLGDVGDLGLARDQMVQMAKMSVQRTGGVSQKKRAQRRAGDAGEAKEKAEAALKHWVDFFAGKYPVVGTVEYDEAGTPAPPPICEKAMQKRQIKGGKLESAMQGFMGGAGAGGAAGGKAGEMPDFVKERLKQKDAAGSSEERDEL